ncbi:MAG TPA: TldD/PmbA family protein [Spirochaetota bacterium]|nr:TldD/PmbA family protein [Spirochaetota bacterium]
MRIEPPAHLCDKCRWYDVIGTSGRSVPVSFRNNRLYSIAEKESSGLGVRVNVDGKVGFSFTSENEGLEAAMRRAIEIAPFGEPEDYSLPPVSNPPVVALDTGRLEETDIAPVLSAAEETIARILAAFPGAQVDMNISYGSGERRILNSEGFQGAYRHSSFGAGITATIVSPDGVRLSVSEGVSSTGPVSYGAAVERLLWKLERAHGLRRLPGGVLPVICTPKAFASLLGIVASGLSARSVFKGISPFAGKLGQRVFSERFTLSDDPLADGSVYSYPFDDEGVPARTKNIIERGEITEWISNLKYAALLGVRPSGNGSRGHSSLPEPSFSNVVVDGGEDDFDSLRAAVRSGVLVDQFIGLGQSNTLTGEFKASLDLAYAIENGEITGRVKDCMLSGNLFELLAAGTVFSRERLHYGAALVPFALFPAVHFTS